MNAYLLVILVLLLGVYVLDTLADLLNLGHLSDQLPTEFQGLFDPDKYQQSLRYQREGVRFELVRRTFSLILVLGFILMGGFNWVDHYSRQFQWSQIPTGLLFVGILSLGRGLLFLPFSIFDTFVIEAKYGFNKTTP